MKKYHRLLAIFVFLSITGFHCPMIIGAQESGVFLDPYPDGKTIPGDIMPAQAPPAGLNPSLKSALIQSTPLVRIAYLVPANRSANPKAVNNLRSIIQRTQNYFRTQMDELGFSNKTFQFETEADGMTPMVHTVSVAETDAYLRGDIWTRTCTAATNAGLSIWATGEIWLLIPEDHLQAPDGSISGGTSLGAGTAGTGGGVAMLGSDSLVMFDPSYATDDRPYAGLSIPALGPYPLVNQVSFVWFEGATLSSVSSAKCGAVIHELTHAFGLPHDFRHDSNFNGDLMGNGLRGLRGVFNPQRYASDYCRVSLVCGKTLSTSRYFNCSTASGSYPTAVTISTQGSVTPVNGQVKITFAASDGDGLSVAWLQRNGDMVDEMVLSGTQVNSSFSTAYFTPGTADQYAVTVYDVYGNRNSATATITPSTGTSRAPQPYIKISPGVAIPGETITFDASLSTDPDGTQSALSVEWDFNSDGIYETMPSTTKTISRIASQDGTQFVRVRVKDATNANTVSSCVALHVQKPSPIVIPDATRTHPEFSWISKCGFKYQLQSSSNLTSWSSLNLPSVSGNGAILRYVDTASFTDTTSKFFRLSLQKEQ